MRIKVEQAVRGFIHVKRFSESTLSKAQKVWSSIEAPFSLILFRWGTLLGKAATHT
jgi:hypothetical protein